MVKRGVLGWLVALGMAGVACNSGSSSVAGGTLGDAGAIAEPDVPSDVEITSTELSGTLGDLGPADPTVSSLMISKSGETILYLSSAPLACADLAESRWLGNQPAGSQMVEIVIKGAPKAQTYTVGPSEVNYAPGRKSSAYEKSAGSGTVTFREANASGPVSGTLAASFTYGAISGQFYAEFCAGGQEY